MSNLLYLFYFMCYNVARFFWVMKKMTKIIINSSIKSSNLTEVIKDKVAVLNDNKILYKDNQINTCVIMDNNLISLIRKSDDMELSLTFEENKNTSGYYSLKNPKLNEVMINHIRLHKQYKKIAEEMEK